MRRISERIMFNNRLPISIFVFIFSLTACNLPSAEQTSSPSDVQTAAALTVEAELLHQMASATIQVTPPTDFSTPTVGPTGTITPTYSVPILSVREQTNCRAGPGQDYDVLFTYLPNVSLEIIGRYEPTNFWLVKSNESPSGECWLWGEYSDASGSYWVVPSVTPPPTATIPPPKAPVILWDYFCSYASNQINVELQWTDVANNETGYRVLRNGERVSELPVNSTTFSETIALIAGETIIYQIEVYNPTGSTRSSPIAFTC
ncbi:MAG: SH3 domain-containing protein [Anaerolineales bacterium]|nr:SH3 domain-containing protein [Anaerolineales bacterium]